MRPDPGALVYQTSLGGGAEDGLSSIVRDGLHHGDEQQWVNPSPPLLQELMRTIKAAPRGVNK